MGIFDAPDTFKTLKDIVIDVNQSGGLQGNNVIVDTPQGPMPMGNAIQYIRDQRSIPLNAPDGSFYLMCDFIIGNSTIVDQDRPYRFSSDWAGNSGYNYSETEELV